jgi:hypothetical protein
METFVGPRKTRTSAPQLGPTATLAEHLLAVREQHDGALGNLIWALWTRDLWQGWAELPEGIEPGQTVILPKPAHVRTLTTTMPDGSRALAVFSTEAAVVARNAQAFPVKIPGTTVLRPLLESDDYGGAVLDPAGPVCQVLLAQWIRDAVANKP